MAGGVSHYSDDEGTTGPIADINVTPLVDIILVLLIIFMVAAPLIERTKALENIETPKASTGQDVKTTLALAIDKNRALYLNGVPIANHDALREALIAEVARNPDIQAVMQVDRVVSYADFVDLLDTVRAAGVRKHALAVEERTEAK